jgi:ribosome assembly protein 4
MGEVLNDMSRILCQLKSETGEPLGTAIDIPLSVNKSGLEKLVHALLIAENKEADEDVPYAFFVNDDEISNTLEETLKEQGHSNFEKTVDIIYQPQALYK